MRFEEALAAMREGKKVRRKSWRESGFMYIKNGIISDDSGFNDLDAVGVENVLADDWEIYEEPKWEPKAGEYFCQIGFERDTFNQAEAATKILRSFSRLLAYVDEHSEEGEVRDYVVYYGGERYCYIAEGEEHDLGAVLMSKRVAEILCDDLNSGRVEL